MSQLFQNIGIQEFLSNHKQIVKNYAQDTMEMMKNPDPTRVIANILDDLKPICIPEIQYQSSFLTSDFNGIKIPDELLVRSDTTSWNDYQAFVIPYHCPNQEVLGLIPIDYQRIDNPATITEKEIILFLRITNKLFGKARYTITLETEAPTILEKIKSNLESLTTEINNYKCWVVGQIRSELKQ